MSLSCVIPPTGGPEVARWRDDDPSVRRGRRYPEHSCPGLAKVAVAVRDPALEDQAVALCQEERLVTDPDLQSAFQHDDALLVGVMRIRLGVPSPDRVR